VEISNSIKKYEPKILKFLNPDIDLINQLEKLEDQPIKFKDVKFSDETKKINDQLSNLIESAKIAKSKTVIPNQ
jgi:hypothetical protein